MREQPTLRIPLGILGLVVALTAFALVVARYVPEFIGAWPVWAQTLIYVILGVIWLLPLKRFLIWMETGSFTPPDN